MGRSVTIWTLRSILVLTAAVAALVIEGDCLAGMEYIGALCSRWHEGYHIIEMAPACQERVSD